MSRSTGAYAWGLSLTRVLMLVVGCAVVYLSPWQAWLAFAVVVALLALLVASSAWHHATRALSDTALLVETLRQVADERADKPQVTPTPRNVKWMDVCSLVSGRHIH